MAPYDTIQLKVGPSWLDKKCSEFGPPVYPASAHSVRIPVFDLLPQIQLEAVLWGIGTALGELPPYFISRAGKIAMPLFFRLKLSSDYYIEEWAWCSGRSSTWGLGSQVRTSLNAKLARELSRNLS
jgi:hypothetical protein